MAKRIQRQAQTSVRLARAAQVTVISILLSLPMIGCTGVSGFSHLPEPPSYKLEVPNCYPQIKSAYNAWEDLVPPEYMKYLNDEAVNKTFTINLNQVRHGIHVFRTAIDCQEERTELYRAKMRLYKAYIEGINE